ncbi:Magnesium-dependent phosphatase-1 [Theobroma cacao]|nr:Magnesium-dependent phosphatase-1 [Theobroma cacao]
MELDVKRLHKVAFWNLQASEKHGRGGESEEGSAGDYQPIPEAASFGRIRSRLYSLAFLLCCDEDETPYLYQHAKAILLALKEKGIDIAIASRSPTPQIAKTFLDKLGIRSMFVAEEIFSSWTHKTEHFQRIHRRTGVPFSSMLFFDDEDRNIEAVSKMGVTSIYVGNGVNFRALRQGLSEFLQKSEPSSGSRQMYCLFSERIISTGSISTKL